MIINAGTQANSASALPPTLPLSGGEASSFYGIDMPYFQSKFVLKCFPKDHFATKRKTF
jgi:hypothetical protein